ncbi:MAG: cation diffusion facilitator family transporter [Bacillota bacterium]|nr:cation diffusion facilitator family transporter [Bacillota bacterium]
MNKGIKITIFSIVINLLLSAGKFLAGVLGHSSAMISDAVHSASDVFSSIIVIVGLKTSEKEADIDHQYGHERMECMAALLLAGALVGTGLCIGYSGVRSLVMGNYSSPENIALIMAIVSIVVKECMYWYTRVVGKKLGSPALMADAWHHRTDAFSSVGALIGILGAQHGYPFLDSVASVVICIFILIAGYGVYKDATSRMTDSRADNEEDIRDFILKNAKLDMLKTRKFGNRTYVDAEIALDGRMSLYEAHSIAEKLHDQIEKEFPEVKHIMIHVNPVK